MKEIPTGTEAIVCADIAKRQAVGIKKYGTTVEGNPLPFIEWLRHSYQEKLDDAIYMMRAIQEAEKGPSVSREAVTRILSEVEEKGATRCQAETIVRNILTEELHPK